MARYLYRITRYIAVFLVLYNLITRGINFDTLRNFYLIISLIIFLIISILYEKKRIIFTPTYMVYFVVVFIIQNVSPYTYIDNKMMLETIVRNPYARIPDDHYSLYFCVFIIVNLMILMYLLASKRPMLDKLKLKIESNIYEARDILLISAVVLLPIQVVLGSTFRKLLIPCSTYFIISIFLFRNTRTKKTYIMGAILSIAAIISQITWRFIAVQYILPIIVAIVLFKSFTTIPRKIKFREKVILSFIIIGIIIYGITSEMYKLGALNSFSDLGAVITNTPILFNWLDRQEYRIFGIWTVLGGNIIDYVNDIGYFYWLTYIKVLSPIFGFNYISLPTISAQMVGANYAQPGLVAEGYANFGIIGAVMNILGVIIVLEYIWLRFLKKQTMLNFLLVIIPFTSILLDGGSINSVIFNIIVINIAFFIRHLKLSLKGNRVESKI